MNHTLIDIGVNLVHRRFAPDREAVLRRAQAAGVAAMIVTGTRVAESRAALRLARAHPGVLWCTAGIHPHSARELDDESMSQLRELATDSPVVAIGECGLDYDRDFSPRPLQRACFERQLDLAAELNLPVFLHERKAHADFQAILREHRPQLAGVVVHCFTGSRAELESYLELDCHVGLTGWVTDARRAGPVREAMATLPRDRVMLETDAPFLLPKTAPRSSGRNEPSHLPLVLEAVAELMELDSHTLASLATSNTERFFGLRVGQLTAASHARSP